MQDRFPPRLLTLPKKSFDAPLAMWFRTSLRDFLNDHPASGELLKRGMVSENGSPNAIAGATVTAIRSERY